LLGGSAGHRHVCSEWLIAFWFSFLLACHDQTLFRLRESLARTDTKRGAATCPSISRPLGF
jgi:hypothetical protein